MKRNPSKIRSKKEDCRQSESHFVRQPLFEKLVPEELQHKIFDKINEKDYYINKNDNHYHRKERNVYMNNGEFEQLLGLCCAPTLTGLKSASLVSFQRAKFQDIYMLLEEYAPCFRCKGIAVLSMVENQHHMLVLFYRPAALSRLLELSGARSILKKAGYHLEDTLSEKLEYLRSRILQNCGFPHEIGLFLGYPPADVRGFIEHKGKDFLYSGYWKVYTNEKAARELFYCYSKCIERFCLNLQRGIPLQELLQAV